MFAKRRTKI